MGVDMKLVKDTATSIKGVVREARLRGASTDGMLVAALVHVGFDDNHELAKVAGLDVEVVIKLRAELHLDGGAE
jgi:hypothetical protein